jgi:hypothetical protein
VSKSFELRNSCAKSDFRLTGAEVIGGVGALVGAGVGAGVGHDATLEI